MWPGAIVLLVGASVALLSVTVWLIYTHKSSSARLAQPLELRFVPNQSLTPAARSWGGREDQTDIVIESLQYYFTSIQLAQTVETSGTGYTNPQGVLNLYSKDMELYDSFGYEQGVTDTSGGYKELMDDSFKIQPDLSELTKATEYQYILLNWMRPIRIKATALAQTVEDVEYPALYTKAGGTNALAVNSSGPEDYTAYQTTITNMTTGPAKTAVILNNNGGSFLKFQKPLTVDPAQKQQVLLVVDPYINLQARVGQAQGNFYSLRDDEHDAFFNVPISDMTAVVLPETATLVRHRYRIVLNKGESQNEPQWDLLLQTYASSQEPEALLAVNLSIMKQATDEVLHTDAPQAAAHVFFLEQNDEGWQLLEYNRRAFVRNFVPAETGACDVRCSYGICGNLMVMQQEDSYRNVAFIQMD